MKHHYGRNRSGRTAYIARLNPKQTGHSHWISLVVFSFLLATGLQLDAAVFTWDGGGAAGNWSPDGAPTPDNSLTFGTAGAVRLNNTNDFATGTSFTGITFANIAGFTLNGNAILLGLIGIDHTSGVGANTVNLAGITLTANQTWSTTVNGLQTIASPINLNGFNLSLDTSGGGTSMTISGPISGSGNITKLSNGILTLSGANSYVGDTTAQSSGSFGAGHMRILGTANTTIGNFIVNVLGTASGKLDFQNEGSLGLASNVIKLNPTGGTSEAAWFRNLGAATLANPVEIGGTVLLGGAETTPGNSVTASSQPLTFNGTITLTGNATIQSGINSATVPLTFNGPITETGGSRSITISLPGRTIRISGAGSTYSGGLRFESSNVSSPGLLELGSDDALGLSSGLFRLTAAGGAANRITAVGGSRVFGNAISLESAGALRTSGNITFNGAATLSGGNRTIQVENSSLTLGGGVGESGGTWNLTKTGAGTLVLGAGGSYSGTTTNSAGILIVAGNNALGTAAAGTVILGGATLGFQGNINYTTAEAVTSVSGAGVSSLGAIRNFSGNNAFAGPITLAGNTTLGADAGNLALGGAINETVASTLTKGGVGTISLEGANTFSGNTIVSAGTLLVNNSTGSGTGSGAVTVNSGGTLGGTGTISGAVTVNAGGTIGAGNSPGILHLGGGLTLANDSTNFFELNGTVAGTAYDQLDVTGAVSLDSSAILSLSLGYTPTLGDSYTIVLNDGTDLVSGLYKEASGNTLSQEEEFGYNPGGTLGFKINYLGGTGNDIVLIAVPEPATVALLGLAAVFALRRRRR
jgi:fibronectin-binding autotransporter adhesin